MGIHSKKLLVPCRFYNPIDVFSEQGLSRGRSLNCIPVHLSSAYRQRATELEKIVGIKIAQEKF